MIIGAGPAGMMAAIKASNKDCNVTIIEKNNMLGKKLLITGGGRCNIASNVSNEEFYSHITENPKFLYSALNYFSKDDLLNFFENKGVSFKTEGNKIYPQDNSAEGILSVLETLLISNKVNLRLKEQVTDLIIENEEIKGLITNKGEIKADKVIVCTGGMSYSKTGSDGAFFSVLKSKNIKVSKFYPALVYINLHKGEEDNLVGISISDVVLTAKADKKTYKVTGDILFTHNGISGPAALDLSSYISKYEGKDIDLRIDFLPHYSQKKLLELLLQKNKKNIVNRFKGILPVEILKRIMKDYNEKDIFNLNKNEIDEIIKQLKEYKLDVKSFGSIENSMVTKGGVDLKHIKPSTLESKLVKNLYFAGEALDLDGNTGGYNLQIAFSTGALAGDSASE